VWRGLDSGLDTLSLRLAELIGPGLAGVVGVKCGCLHPPACLSRPMGGPGNGFSHDEPSMDAVGS